MLEGYHEVDIVDTSEGTFLRREASHGRAGHGFGRNSCLLQRARALVATWCWSRIDLMVGEKKAISRGFFR